eukprot:COSAG06_NODE_961_length_11312_cov_10.559351_3_plen_429_part_00
MLVMQLLLAALLYLLLPVHHRAEARRMQNTDQAACEADTDCNNDGATFSCSDPQYTTEATCVAASCAGESICVATCGGGNRDPMGPCGDGNQGCNNRDGPGPDWIPEIDALPCAAEVCDSGRENAYWFVGDAEACVWSDAMMGPPPPDGDGATEASSLEDRCEPEHMPEACLAPLEALDMGAKCCGCGDHENDYCEDACMDLPEYCPSVECPGVCSDYYSKGCPIVDEIFYCAIVGSDDNPCDIELFNDGVTTSSCDCSELNDDNINCEEVAPGLLLCCCCFFALGYKYYCRKRVSKRLSKRLRELKSARQLPIFDHSQFPYAPPKEKVGVQSFDNPMLAEMADLEDVEEEEEEKEEEGTCNVQGLASTAEPEPEPDDGSAPMSADDAAKLEEHLTAMAEHYISVCTHLLVVEAVGSVWSLPLIFSSY